MGISAPFDSLWDKLSGWFETLVLMAPNLLAAAVVLAVFMVASKWLRRGMVRLLLRATGNAPISSLLGTAFRLLAVFLGVVLALGLLHLDKTVTSVLAGVGVLGIALGFAFQDIAANFLSGLLMAINRPIDVGNLVELDGKKGKVERIELRATVLTTLDGLSVIIPNKNVYQSSIINTLTFLVSMAALVTFLADRFAALEGHALGLPLRGWVAMALSVLVGALVNRGPKMAARAAQPPPRCWRCCG